MELFLFSLTGLGVAFGAMAIGIPLGRGPLARGCSRLGEEICDACTRPCARRRARPSRDPAA